jgi:hypothetical protein
MYALRKEKGVRVVIVGRCFVVCVVYWARTDVVPDLDAALVVLVAPLHLVLDELHPTCNTSYVRPDSIGIMGYDGYCALSIEGVLSV